MKTKIYLYQDGVVYIWDQDTGELLQKLRGHTGVVYEAAWNAKQGMMASCSDDQTVKVWNYDEKVSFKFHSISITSCSPCYNSILATYGYLTFFPNKLCIFAAFRMARNLCSFRFLL